MAFEKLGVGGVLTFDDAQAVRAMTRTQRIFAQLKKSAVRLRAGMTRLGQGMRSLAIAGVGVGIGIGIGVKKAADFEHQMSAVGAVTGASAKSMKALEKKAISMGINTQFSATQSAQAMELLGKASWGTAKILDKVGTVVALAAAEQMELSAATQIVTDTIGAMNLKGKQQGEVADVLALAAMKAQTGVAQLGEAMSYGAANAKDMGLGLYQTAGTMALFAKAGIRGSRAGTAMNAIMRGLQGATAKSRAALKGLGIDMKKFYTKGKLNMGLALSSISEALEKKFKHPLDRNRKVLELFSIRGQTAFNVLAGQGGDALTKLTGILKGSTKMTVKGMKEKGAAAIMAAKRMNNLRGATTLLKSSIEAFSIIVTKTFLGSMKKSIQDFTSRFNRFLKVMMALGEDDSLKTQEALAKKFGKTTVQVALGIRDGLKMISDSINLVKDGIKKLASMMGKHIGEGSTRQIVKVLVAFTGLLAVIAPLMAGLGAVKFMFGALFKVASGALMSLAALFWPLVIIAGILGLAFLALRKNGESFGQTFIRVFKQIYSFGKQLFYDVLLPMGKIFLKGVVGFFNEIKPALKAVFTFVRTVISDIAGIIKDYTIGLKSLWISVAKTIKSLFIDAGKVISKIIKAVMAIVKPLWKVIVDGVKILRPVFVVVIKYVMSAAKVVMGLIKKIMNLYVEVAKLIGAVITELRPVMNFLFKVISVIAAVLIPIMATLFRIGIKIVGVFYEIAVVLVRTLKPIIVWTIRAFKTLFKAIYAVGKALVKALLWPFRMLAKGLYKIVDKMVSISKYIPGVSTKTLKKMSDFLYEAGYGEKPRIVSPAMKFDFSKAEAERRKVIAATAKRALSPVELKMIARMHAPQRAKIVETVIGSKKGLEAARRKERLRQRCIDLKLKNNIKLKAPVNIGGRQVAQATADHQDEIRERAGFSTKPWQKRQVKARAAVLTPFDD